MLVAGGGAEVITIGMPAVLPVDRGLAWENSGGTGGTQTAGGNIGGVFRSG